MNFIFVKNPIKRHNCDVKNTQLVHVLPTSVNSKVISLFREGFISMKLRENKFFAKISEYSTCTFISSSIG